MQQCPLRKPKAFYEEKAELTNLAKSPEENNYIGEVLHYTFISVDELDTKACAVTKVAVNFTSAVIIEKTVKLDRPFVYAIIDNSTNLPIFLGTVMSIK